MSKSIRCTVCGELINDEVIFADNRFWCSHHFTCCRCNVMLKVDKYDVFDKKHYCPTCFEIVRPKCLKCNQPVAPNEEYVKMGRLVCHRKLCFACEDCKKVLNPQSFALLEEKTLLCEDCCVKRHKDK